MAWERKNNKLEIQILHSKKVKNSTIWRNWLNYNGMKENFSGAFHFFPAICNIIFIYDPQELHEKNNFSLKELHDQIQEGKHSLVLHSSIG